MSRKDRPKPFLDLTGEGSLYQQTLKRLLTLDPSEIVIVASNEHREIIQSQSEFLERPFTILGEPRGRNTAAAVIYAATFLAERNPGSTMVVLPADHYIPDTSSFRDDILLAAGEAENGNLITLGVSPDRPETGYGYIQAPGEGKVRRVLRFVEKPDLSKAEEYLSSGDYFWNSGIFLWREDVIRRSFEDYLPAHARVFRRLLDPKEKIHPWQQSETVDSIYDEIDSISIDKGILEKSTAISMIPSGFTWKDLGSWDSLDDLLPDDGAGNRASSDKDVLFTRSSNCSVFTESMRVAVAGLDNVIIVQSGESILVMERGASQDVREIAMLMDDQT
jgi:mannose-1-phosphate guanylyltransferase